jgi:nucleoside-diphosphate-sugar epimerase
LRTIALRPHIVLGPGDNHLLPRLLVQARAGKLRQIGPGRNQVDISFIDNVVAAHICAIKAIMKNPEVTGRVFFVTNGKPVLLWETINRILEKSGIDPIDKSVPVKTAMIYSLLAEMFHKIPIIKQEPRLTRFLVHELSGSHWFNIDAARRLLNYNPEAGDVEKLISLTGIPPGEIK